MFDYVQSYVYEIPVYNMYEGLTLYQKVCMGFTLANDAQKCLQIFREDPPPEKDATPLLEERIDAPKLGIGHLPGTESMDCDLLEATTSPKRKHSTIRRDRVQSAVQTEMEYETSGRVHQDHVERRNRRSHSPPSTTANM